MKPFLSVAIPHRDIIEGRLTLDTFAADLWEVFQNRAPEEYLNPDIFFRRTHLTSGLKNLIDIAEKRLKGLSGDSIIQLQTPFGGGKTHALIALYHKAKEWGANIIVIDGTVLDPKEKVLWEQIEYQLTNKIEKLRGHTSPGREKLREVLQNHQPILILIDELLEYATKAAGIKIGDSNLASQLLAFIQELTGTINTLEKALLILTLPSSVLEHYDENAEKLFQQLQKITGRMEKVFTPVQDMEIYEVIRRRLFSQINEKEAKEIIEDFLDYAEKEKIFPEGTEKANYREKFLKSYPFQPDVIDVLYKRWGSYPTFQRTRGVLRILALVIYSLKNSKIPFIRIGDFNLNNQEIRREFVKIIGQEFDSIIEADITSSDSGAKKVDKSLGDAYTLFEFGTKVATTIFMYSFSGGSEKGASINEIKISCSEISIPSSIISETITKLKDNLFYLSDTGLFFTNQPNLNRILLNKMESIENTETEEKELIIKNTSKDYFEVYTWPKNSRDIPDTKKIKLIILPNREKHEEFFNNYGERPRIYKNTMIFLVPLDSERPIFDNLLKKKLAWELIEKDKTLSLTNDQKKEIKERIKKSQTEVIEMIRNLYRIILIPSRNGFKEIDLGIKTYGTNNSIDQEVYKILKDNGEILEKLHPKILSEKYLEAKDYVKIKDILESFYKTPGEIRITNEEVLKNSIIEGLTIDLFGLGFLQNGEIKCKYHFKNLNKSININLEEEIIIKKELCLNKLEENTANLHKNQELLSKQNEKTEITNKEEKIHIKKEQNEFKNEILPKEEKYNKIRIKLDVPIGKLSDTVKIINFLKSKFNQIDVKVEILVENGELSTNEYEDKIKEALNQATIKIELEELQ